MIPRSFGVSWLNQSLSFAADPVWLQGYSSGIQVISLLSIDVIMLTEKKY